MRTRLDAEKTVRDYSRRHGKHIYQATLGTPAGTVVHPAGDGWVYAQLHGDQNQLIRAYNAAKVPNVAGLVVDLELVEREAASGYEILGVSTNIIYTNNTWTASVPAHADQHQRRDFGAGGFDPLDVYTRALVNLRARAQATPDLTVYVERGFYFINGVLQEWTGGNSPAFVAPAGSPLLVTRRCDLLYLGDDYALHIVQGRVVTDGSLPPYPTAPIPCVPIIYVYLSSNTTTITESYIREARLVASAIDLTLDRAVCHNDSVICHDDEIVYL